MREPTSSFLFGVVWRLWRVISRSNTNCPRWLRRSVDGYSPLQIWESHVLPFFLRAGITITSGRCWRDITSHRKKWHSSQINTIFAVENKSVEPNISSILTPIELHFSRNVWIVWRQAKINNATILICNGVVPTRVTQSLRAWKRRETSIPLLVSSRFRRNYTRNKHPFACFKCCSDHNALRTTPL